MLSPYAATSPALKASLLAREQARSAEAQAETARISQLLAEERQTVDTLRREIRQHPEQLLHLSKQLAEAQADAASARGQRDALQGARSRTPSHDRSQIQHEARQERVGGDAGGRKQGLNRLAGAIEMDRAASRIDQPAELRPVADQLAQSALKH